MRLIISFIVFVIIAYCAPFITKQFLGKNFGLFFGWELGTIIQNLYTFWNFAKIESIPYVSNKYKNILNIIVVSILIFSLIFYFNAKTVWAKNIEKYSSINFIAIGVFLIRDAITLIPIFLYFVINILLRNHIKKRKSNQDCEAQAWVEALTDIIRFIDIPCLLPYLAIIIFAYMNRDHFEWGLFISGAGSLLLLTSNLLTESVGNKIKDKIDKLHY